MQLPQSIHSSSNSTHPRWQQQQQLVPCCSFSAAVPIRSRSKHLLAAQHHGWSQQASHTPNSSSRSGPVPRRPRKPTRGLRKLRLRQRQQQRLRWEQQFADCHSWQQLYASPAFLRRPLTHNKGAILTAAAAMLARMLRQQPAEAAPGPQQQLQQQAGAWRLWQWYSAVVLNRCIHVLLPPAAAAAAAAGASRRADQGLGTAAADAAIASRQQRWLPPEDAQQQQRRQPQQTWQGMEAEPEVLDTVTAAALLQATGAMGWSVDSIVELTRQENATEQLRGICLNLFEAGLQAAFTDSGSSSSSGNSSKQSQASTAADGTSSNTTAPRKLACPPIAVLNLVTAVQELGVIPKQASTQQLQEEALAAALSSSSSSSSGGGGGGAQLGYPAVLKFLDSCVNKGRELSPELLGLLVKYLQDHISRHPHQLLPLLTRLIQRQRQQLRPGGQLLLKDLRSALKAAWAQQPDSTWQQLAGALQYQAVLLLFGQKQCRRMMRPSTAGGSSAAVGSSGDGSNAAGSDVAGGIAAVSRRIRRTSSSTTTGSNCSGGSSGGTSSGSNSSSSSRQELSIPVEAVEVLLAKSARKLPGVQCSFKELLQLSGVVAQLPPHEALSPLKQLLLGAGIQLLHDWQAADSAGPTAAAGAEGQPKDAHSSQASTRSSSISSIEPRHVSSWLTQMSAMGVVPTPPQRSSLAKLLLQIMRDAATAAAAAADGAATGPSQQQHATSLQEPGLSSSSSQARGNSYSYSSSSSGASGGSGSVWGLSTLVPLLSAACELQVARAFDAQGVVQLLQAAAALGMSVNAGTADSAGRPVIAEQLAPVLLQFYEGGLAASVDNSSGSSGSSSDSSSDSSGSGGNCTVQEAATTTAAPDMSSSSSSSSVTAVQLACPAITVVNLLTAAHALGLRLQQPGVLQLQEAVLCAALQDRDSAGRPQLRLNALLRLLQCSVSQELVLPPQGLDMLTGLLQATTASRPTQLLPLLQQLNNLQEQQQQQREQQQQQQEQDQQHQIQQQQGQSAPLCIQSIRADLLLQMALQSHTDWAAITGALQYEAVRQLFGQAVVNQLMQQHTDGHAHSNSSSSSSGRAGGDSGGSNSADATLPTHAVQQLLGAKLPLMQCGFKELLQLSGVVAQLPPHEALSPLKQLLLGAGIQLLARSAAAARRGSGSGSGGNSGGAAVSPGEVTSWLSHMTTMRALPGPSRNGLAKLLLDLLSDAAADGLGSLSPPRQQPPGAAADSGVSEAPSPAPPAAAAAAASSSGNGSSSSSSWSCDTVVAFVSAACDLRLPGAAPSEWWTAVMSILLQRQQQQRQQGRKQQQQQLRPEQVLQVLQCMVRSRHRPEQHEVAQLLAMISDAWFTPGTSTSSPNGTAVQPPQPPAAAAAPATAAAAAAPMVPSTGQGPTLGQMVDLLCVLASLKHKPQQPQGSRVDWWEAFQASFMQACKQQQQQQQQQGELHVQQVQQQPNVPQQQHGLQQQGSQQERLLQQQQQQLPGWLQSWWAEQQGALSTQQQQLDADTAIRVLWATGRLNLNPRRQLLLLLLQQLEGGAGRYDLKQLVGVLVGLAAITKKQQGVLTARVYVQLCEALPLCGAEPAPQDVANLLRCFGSIAATTAGAADGAGELDLAAAAAAGTAGGGFTAAAADALATTSWEEDETVVSAAAGQQDAQSSMEQQQQQQQQQQELLLPPEGVLDWLLHCVEGRLQDLSDTSLTMMLWGLRKLGHRPSKEWTDSYQQEVLQRASSNPGLADHQCAIICACLVHLGLPPSLPLLQQLLFRAPRTNLSPGIMTDLRAALLKLEQQDPTHWEQQLLLEQQRQQQQQGVVTQADTGLEQGQVRPEGDGLPLWRQRQQLSAAAAAARAAAMEQQGLRSSQQQQQLLLQQQQGEGGSEAVDGSAAAEVDLDALIDNARADLALLMQHDQPQQQQQEQYRELGVAAADGDAGDDFVPLSPTAAAAVLSGEELDEPTKRRIAAQLAVVQELLADSSS